MNKLKCNVKEERNVPFENAEEVWFWFVMVQQAKAQGARLSRGMASVDRPCETVDILTILDRLYRAKQLQRDHLLVLRHYGRRKIAPDPDRTKERRAAKIWADAMAVLSTPLEEKGIIRPQEIVMNFDDDVWGVVDDFDDLSPETYVRQNNLFEGF